MIHTAITWPISSPSIWRAAINAYPAPCGGRWSGWYPKAPRHWSMMARYGAPKSFAPIGYR
jgi:hypothetical protein